MALQISSDLHTYGGYVGEKDIFYTYDGVRFGIFDDVTPYLAAGKGTNGNYAPQLSTVATYFDGPLSRDGFDSTYVAFDWARVYKTLVNWQPEVDFDYCNPLHNAVLQPLNVSPVIKFTKTMNFSTITPANIEVKEANGGSVPSYTIQQMTPLRYQIKFSQNLGYAKTYNIRIKSAIKDNRGYVLTRDTVLRFSTISQNGLNVTANGTTSIKQGEAIQLSATASGGSGDYVSYMWTGPKNFSFIGQTPTIQLASLNMGGDYNVVVTDSNGNSGTATVHVVVEGPNGLSPVSLFDKIYIYPNPCKGFLNIYDPAFEEGYELNLSIVDLAGRVVLNKIIHSTENSINKELDLRFVTKGMYMLKLFSAGKEKNMKIIVS